MLWKHHTRVSIIAIPSHSIDGSPQPPFGRLGSHGRSFTHVVLRNVYHGDCEIALAMLGMHISVH
jgi:hypothetical protein